MPGILPVSRRVASRRSASLTIAQRQYTLYDLCPVIFVATLCGTPRRSIFGARDPSCLSARGHWAYRFAYLISGSGFLVWPASGWGTTNVAWELVSAVVVAICTALTRTKPRRRTEMAVRM